MLQGLDVIPRTAGVSAGLVVGEDSLVATVEEDMKPREYDPAFCAAVLRKWRSNAVSSVLRARGVLQTGIAACQQHTADFHARQRADIAKHGLRECALPSCSKTEKTVKEFAGCSGCRSVVYSAWSIRRSTGERTKRRAAKRRRRGWLKRERWRSRLAELRQADMDQREPAQEAPHLWLVPLTTRVDCCAAVTAHAGA